MTSLVATQHRQLKNYDLKSADNPYVPTNYFSDARTEGAKGATGPPNICQISKPYSNRGEQIIGDQDQVDIRKSNVSCKLCKKIRR